MPYVEFDPVVESLKEDAIHMAKQAVPEIIGAHQVLDEAKGLLLEHDWSVVRDLHMGRLACDDEVIDIRHGLYLRNYQELSDDQAAEMVWDARAGLINSYLGMRMFSQPGGLRSGEEQLLPKIKANIGATQKVIFQTTQTHQALTGQLTKEKKATSEIAADQWMLGRGRLQEPGAYANGKEGDNKYWSTQTCFIGVRGEVVNGGLEHYLKAAKWLVRGLPELAKATLLDGEDRKMAWLTTGRLTLELLSRQRALAAIVDHQQF